MTEYAEIARATGPYGELVLRSRRDPEGEVLELRANGIFVMDTVETSSERAMATATMAASRVSGSRPERVLVGGLGLGFTLAEVLGDAHVEQVTVVEIEPALVGWMRDGTISHGTALVSDPRVELVLGDVADALRESAPAAYDLVLLDVDNGPGYLVHESNAELYEAELLEAARTALRPGGTLVIWSAFEEPELPIDVTAVFGSCRALAVPVELQGRQEHYWLYAASCPLP